MEVNILIKYLVHTYEAMVIFILNVSLYNQSWVPERGDRGLCHTYNAQAL